MKFFRYFFIDGSIYNPTSLRSKVTFRKFYYADVSACFIIPKTLYITSKIYDFLFLNLFSFHRDFMVNSSIGTNHINHKNHKRNNNKKKEVFCFIATIFGDSVIYLFWVLLLIIKWSFHMKRIAFLLVLNSFNFKP